MQDLVDMMQLVPKVDFAFYLRFICGELAAILGALMVLAYRLGRRP